MKKWKILGKQKRDIVKTLLGNRGLKTKKEIEEFLNPKLDHVTTSHVAINPTQLAKAIKRIKKAIKAGEQIIVYGDYDVDGICGTAILWETLNGLGAKVLPYIPHRIEEGYGLSKIGISNIKSQISNIKLIITVDNGIVANEAVEFAKKEGIDVIITDHHLPGKKLPKAYAIVHTTKLSGAGVAWVLARQCHSESAEDKTKNLKRSFPVRYAQGQDDSQKKSHLELVALATIADMVPFLGPNRTLTKYGLEKLRQTKRAGLLELFREAGLERSKIGVYEVGHLIAPRINAMGRLEYAMDSLRLLCTKDLKRAQELAQKLGRTNRERQQLTEETTAHASAQIQNSKFKSQNLLFISHESYQQGVIGLVAGKLVEEFYRPAIVVSKGEKYSKASARSISGFNIIEFIRSASEFLIDAGGHPMAAGFTVETKKLLVLQEKLEKAAKKLLDEEKLMRTLRVDCEINFADINNDLYEKIQEFSPFGMGNPEPTFVSRKVLISDMRLVGLDGKHLKLFLCHPERSEGSRDSSSRQGGTQNDKQLPFEAIAFGLGEKAGEIKIGDSVDIVYTIEENEWSNQKKLQLKIRDFKPHH